MVEVENVVATTILVVSAVGRGGKSKDAVMFGQKRENIFPEITVGAQARQKDEWFSFADLVITKLTTVNGNCLFLLRIRFGFIHGPYYTKVLLNRQLGCFSLPKVRADDKLKDVCMIKCGVDLVSISEFEKRLQKGGAPLIKKIFLEKELENTGVAHLAGVFAAKEAVLKALALPVGSWQHIEIAYNKKGRPKVWVGGKKFKESDLSISHAGDYAVAVFTVEG